MLILLTILIILLKLMIISNKIILYYMNYADYIAIFNNLHFSGEVVDLSLSVNRAVRLIQERVFLLSSVVVVMVVGRKGPRAREVEKTDKDMEE